MPARELGPVSAPGRLQLGPRPSLVCERSPAGPNAAWPGHRRPCADLPRIALRVGPRFGASRRLPLQAAAPRTAQYRPQPALARRWAAARFLFLVPTIQAAATR